ncbi:hypothetical protein MALGJ_26730 [Mycolicibacter algericus]|uniref:Uncharacterized protein n=1 Tax=Mycolicibacter algericus TaxID=1288388 RepID=A0A7I9YBG1_MYCAL|nr:hypothetical protein MALGJ_26730 [Mycolicibacter algericus]
MDEVGARRGQMQRYRSAEGMPDDHDGAAGAALEQPDQRRHVGVDSPRGRPRRVPVADEIRCGDSGFRQLPGDVSPAGPMAGQAVHGQQLYRAGRTIAVHVQPMIGIHPSMVPALTGIVRG